MTTPRSLSKAKAREVLRRANYGDALIDEIMAQLPDPFDLDRDSAVLMRYGLNRDTLIGRAGGSP
ncbi:MAG TPA: hypothetical protein VGF64_14325 [Acidimicrobiales bacterium]